MFLPRIPFVVIFKNLYFTSYCSDTVKVW